MSDFRTIDEAYASASNSSDLRVEADRRGDADLLIAAGWSQSRIGGALLRLHSEWDAASRPPMVTAAQFLRPASANTTAQQRTDAKAVALEMAHTHNLHETALQLSRCKSLPAVREQLALVLRGWGVDAPDDAVAAILRWRLGPACPRCNGTRYAPIAGSDRLSGKVCKGCCGTGVARAPFGDIGKRLANFMDESTSRARTSIGKSLREYPTANRRHVAR